MGNDRYEVRINVPGPNGTHMVVHGEEDRFVGGFGGNYFRSWAFPLYTPSGLTVLQEFAYDHPFHNGIFVAQNPVLIGGRETNYWGLPIRRSADDHIMAHIGRADAGGEAPAVAVEPGGVRFTLPSVWRDENEEPVLDEERMAVLRALPDANVCDVTSRKQAVYGAVEFAHTKFGSIGMRVEPRLLPGLGGEIVAATGDDLRRGTADDVANAKLCDFVAYEAAHPTRGPWGVCMLILANSAAEQRDGPWFIRDYGQAMFNATQDGPIRLGRGDVWTAALRVVAYDGALTLERVSAWRDV